MMVYIFCTASTTLMAYIANICINKGRNDSKYRTAGYLLLLGIVFIFSIIAAIRTYDIGTDISFYGNPVFYEARRMSFIDLFHRESGAIEPLYLLLAKLSAMVSNEPHFQYFLIEFLICGFVILRLMDLRDTHAMWVAVLLFNTFFYPSSLNYMRQSIAMAIVFFATRYLDKNNIKFFLLVLLAACFHVTAVFGLTFWIIKQYLSIHRVQRHRLWYSFLLIMVLLIAVISLGKIINLIIGLGGFFSKFSRYEIMSFDGFQINPILIRLPFIFFILLFWNQYNKYKKENFFLFLVMIIELILVELRAYSSTLYRFSLYYAYMKMVSMPNLLQSIKIKNNRKILGIIIAAIAAAVWFYQVVIQGNEGVYPYHSTILGI
jgi:hypothetical protein